MGCFTISGAGDSLLFKQAMREDSAREQSGIFSDSAQFMSIGRVKQPKEN